VPPARIRVLAALVERVGRRRTTGAPEDEDLAGREPPRAEPVEHEPQPEVEPEPQPAVSERSARALLATGPPPLPPEPAKPKLETARRRRPEPPPPRPVGSGPPRAWNIWELQRVARERPGDERQEEWSAILMHLREFANADGELPIDFDGLVRESFAGVLEAEPEAATAAT
jgi:hypothetical protein